MIRPSIDAFAASLRRLLEDPGLRARPGRAARERVRREFLGLRHLTEYARLLEHLEV